MVTQHGIKLAVHLISSYFGEVVSKICECLLRRGSLPLSQIIRYTELSKTTVVNSLLVLIQQNSVQAFAMQQERGFGEAPRIVTQYTALFDNIIHKLRFPKFLAIVSDELGKECEDIFEGLAQHGRLSLDQIIDRHKQTSNLTRDVIEESFKRLANARFVERCPAPEPFLAPPNEEETPAKKRIAKSKTVVQAETNEQHALATAAPMESMRFLVETNTWSDDASGQKGKENENLTSVAVGEKRKLESSDLDSEVLDRSGEKEVLWRVNFDEFVRRLRHKACIANVRAHFDDEVGIVLTAILEATRGAETSVKAYNTAPLSLDSIMEEVMKSEDGRRFVADKERLKASLVQLGCQLPAIEIDETYSVDLKSIIERAQNDEVESIVLKRYGNYAYRMFRLLSKAGRFVETDKISDITFVDKKDIAKILYGLWKDEYLHMERVTAHGAKESHFLLWKVNRQTLWVHVLDEMYHAALNLRLRIAHEKEKDKEIVQLPKEKLVGELASRYQRQRKIRIVLESSLMKLDDALMLFHDF